MNNDDVEYAVRGAVNDAVWRDVRCAVEAVVRDAVEGAVEGAVWRDVYVAVDAAVRGAVWDAVWSDGKGKHNG